METRVLVLCAWCAAVLQAQSIAVAVPGANQSLSGWSGSSFAVSISSAPNVSMVCYTVDAHPATNPGLGALSTAGCSDSGSNYVLPIDTFWWLNGPHQAVATAYDALGAAIVSSNPVPFTIANAWPVTCNPTLTVTTGTPVASDWSGQVSVQGAMTGACAADSLTFNWYINGVQQGPSLTNVTSGTAARLLDTTAWQNGPANVGMTVLDLTNGVSYANGAVSAAAEWTRTVTFSNAAVGAEVRSNAREIFLAPAATFTLSPSIVNTDGTVASSRAFDYYDRNAGAATISASSGSSVTVTGVASGSAQILVMGETQSGTDGSPALSTLSFFTSSSYTLRASDTGRVLAIKGGTNCIAGLYYLNSVNPASNFAVLTSPQDGTTSANFATSTSARCTWALGPTRSVYALVNSTRPPVPHFSNAGSILKSGYAPGQSMVLNEGFDSILEFSSQPYPVPFLTSVCNSGFNTIETGVTPNLATGWGASQSAFASGQAAWVASQAAVITGCPRLRLFGTADNLTRSPASLFAVTQGPSSAWSPTGTAIIFQSLLGPGLFVGVSWMDEINNWGQNPLQGPIRPGTGTIQNWLSSIAASSGNCMATATTTTPGGKYSIFGPQFAISGSVTSGMNSTVGNLYTLSGVDGTHFTFPCSGVANGTYNSGNDPGLTIQDLSAGGWVGSSFLFYDAWASVVNQANSVAGRTPVAGSQAAQTNVTAVTCWEGGPCGQSIVEGGNTVSNISDWCDVYWSHAGVENYLPARQSLNALITDTNSSAGPEEGYWLRNLYGACDPTKPLTTISQGTSNLYAFDSVAASAVTSCMGNTITFASPHMLTNVVPGLSRMTISGSTDANCNRQFIILAAPTATTLTAVYAATRTACTGACSSGDGGTLTFQNGDMLTLVSISAGGVTGAMGESNDSFTYTGSASNNVNRHRGQTFTLSGVTGAAASYFNSTTFYYDIENLIDATDGNGSASASNNYFREMPNLNGSGGTARIVMDNFLVKGRTPSDELNPGDSDPRFAFASVIEAMNLRAAGHRFYQFEPNPQAYVDHASPGPPLMKGGWVGESAPSAANSFSSAVTAGLGNQLYSHPNVENSYSVPEWHAASIASMMWTRLAKFNFAVPRNSPDYGPELDCSAYTGSYGSLLICLNASNGPATRTFSLTPYETANQNVIRYTARYNGIGPVKIVGAGVSTDMLTLQEGDAVFYVFPAVFSTEYQAPSIAVRLADVTNAADIAVRFSYDLYNLDSANAAYDCGASGVCALPVDTQIGTLYYKIIYRDSSGAVLATSDVQTF